MLKPRNQNGCLILMLGIGISIASGSFMPLVGTIVILVLME